MKKMYVLTLCIIAVITVVFLLFSSDIHNTNRRFLASYGISVSDAAADIEQISIPEEFDGIYAEYNLLQLECGLDLSPYKGRKAVRYTYRVLNFPDAHGSEIFADVICVNRAPVAGDIMCPSLAGFMKPLNILMKY